MLPRTPIAPETLLASSTGATLAVDKREEDNNSNENGSTNGDALSNGLDASQVLGLREKSLISRAMETVANSLKELEEPENGEDEVLFDVEGDLIQEGIIKFQLSTPEPMPAYLNVHFICETASRLLFLSIHWVRSIKAFSQLR